MTTEQEAQIDFSNAKDVKARNKKVKTEAQLFLEKLELVMKDPNGRDVLYWLLDESYMFSPNLDASENTHETYKRLGMRQLGMTLYAKMAKANSALCAKIMLKG